MKFLHRLLTLLLLAAASSTGGCNWSTMFRRNTVQASPVAFTGGLPTGEQLALAVNANTAKIRQLQTQGATLRVPGMPAVSADIAMERPLRFRFRAGTTLTGPEADFGSNDELFWFWIARSPQPSLFYATHARYAQSPVRAQLPIEPSWLIEGMGLTEISPHIPWEGPYPAGNDRVEIRGRVQTSSGELFKTLAIHNRFAWILEQKLTDARGQPVAISKTSEHQFYQADGVSLPQKIEISVPSMQASFTLDVNRWQINALDADASQLFTLPREQLATYPLVDLTAPPPGSPPAQQPYAPPGYAPPSAAPQPRLSYAPDTLPQGRIRGLR